MTTPSHRLKLHRANKHLSELDNLVQPLRRYDKYPVVETIERDGDQWVSVYRLDLSAVLPPEEFPVVFGDYLFNIRSALDHLAVALAPKGRKRAASFPIFTDDPLATAPSSGDYLQADEASRWFSLTKGLPDECVADLYALQPFESARIFGGRAQDHALAVLSTLQNADKHRNLVGVLTGLEKAHATINGEVLGVVPVLRHRAVISRSPTKMEVQVEGTPTIGIGEPNKVRPLDGIVVMIGRFISDELLPRLERYLPT